jgi:hypothetical protein
MCYFTEMHWPCLFHDLITWVGACDLSWFKGSCDLTGFKSSFVTGKPTRCDLPFAKNQLLSTSMHRWGEACVRKQLFLRRLGDWCPCHFVCVTTRASLGLYPFLKLYFHQ